MTLFETLVLNMRISQKQYFKTRDQAWLAKSKDFEKQVDDYLNGLTAPKLNV